MAYFTQYHADGTTEITSGAPLDFGTLNKDDEDVSDWLKVIVKADADLESSGDSTVTPVDTVGATEDYFQLAAFTAGDTVEPAATPGAYGAPLTIAATIDDTTGVPYWVRRKSVTGESPATITDGILRVTGTVVPAA